MSSCPVIVQGSSHSLLIYLEDSDGNPVTGLADTDLTADLRKGSGSFIAFPLSGSNFSEVGDGFYDVTLSSTDTDTLGNLYLRVTGADIKTALFSALVAESVPTSPTSALTVSTTSLFGYVYDSGGSPVSGASVSARILAYPSVQHPNDEAFVLTEDLVTVKTDSAGFFTLDLVTASDVDIFIPAANYRRTLRVPGTSQNLFSIP